MKKLIMFALAALFLASPAFASELISIDTPLATSNASIGPITNTNVNSNTAKSKSEADATAVQGQQQKQGNDQSISSSTSVPAMAPPIFAPNLVASPEACMGSISGGGGAGFNGISFGLSLGSTWKNEDCEIRMFAIRLQAMGPKYENVLVALLSQNSKVKQAFQDAGVAIPGAPAKSAALAPTLAPIAVEGAVIEKKNAALPAGIVALGPTCGDGRPSVIRTGSSTYSCYGYDRDGLAKQ